MFPHPAERPVERFVERRATGHRLFFAIRPPITLARQIAHAASWFDTGRAVRPDHLHVTIDILDDRDTVPTALEQVLIGIGDAVRASPFTVRFDQAVGSRRSVALRLRHRNTGLDALRHAIGAGRQAVGLAEREGYRFAAHMTLGYREGESFSQPIAPVSWTASEFVLIHSHLGKTRHDVVGRWTLTGEDTQLALF